METNNNQTDLVNSLVQVIGSHNTSLQISFIKTQVEHLLSLGKSEIEILATYNVGVEEVTIGTVQDILDIDLVKDCENTSIESYEESNFRKQVEKIDFTTFQKTSRIDTLEVGDLVDFDIRSFLRFIIVKIKGTTIKGGKTYAQCIVNAAKLDTESGQPKKRFLLNREYSIELPLIKGDNLTILSEEGDIACLKIISMSLKRGNDSKIGSFFKKILNT